ncbi:UNVERIFIED_CONTAM: putative carboxypeptidase [Acetivibrio alkalicellulosi]
MNIKKIFIFILVALILVFNLSIIECFSADIEVNIYVCENKVYVNNEKFNNIDVITIDGRVFMPIIETVVILGGTVDRIINNERFNISFKAKKAIIWVGEKYSLVDRNLIMTCSPPILINDKAYISLRHLGELFGYFIHWDDMNKKSIITNKSDYKIKKPCLFVDTSSTYTLEKMYSDIEKIVSNYPRLLKLENIGYSVDGLPIKAIRLGLPNNESKPNILLMGGIHARENFSVMIVMKQLDVILYNYYTTEYFGNYNLRYILDNVNIYFVPSLNPDGMNIIHNGLSASKNHENLKRMRNIAGDYRWWKANANGVDLNRNFDDGNWNKPNSATMVNVPASEGFKGYLPNSEPETKAIQKYCREKNFLLAFSYHTSGEVFFWADADTHHNFEGIDIGIINRLHKLSGYTIMPVSRNPSVFGRGFENWFKKEFNRFAVCVELSPVSKKQFVQHPDNMFDQLVWQKAKYLGIQLAVEAINLQYYDVYQNDSFLKTFYSKEKAIEFAKLWKNSVVKKNGSIIWEG